MFSSCGVAMTSMAAAAFTILALCTETAAAATIIPTGRLSGQVMVSRAMLGRDIDRVDWSSLPMERSPADPDVQGGTSPLEKRIVYNPPVTIPTKDTVWEAGSVQTVRWEVDDANVPASAASQTGEIYLGFLPEDGEGGENLKWHLATGFPITKGYQKVTLPDDLESRTDYIIVVMGDSGNRSKKFEIQSTQEGVKHKKHKHQPQAATQQAAVAPASGKRDAGSDGSKPKTEARAVSSKGMLGRDVQLA